MARTEARIQTAIWHDEDFRSLPADAQRLYFVALSQPNVNFCGVVDYTARRWARLSVDSTARKIESAIGHLEKKRFVVIDEDTEELLIRTFIRHDGVLSSPNILVAMSRDFATIHSTEIRETILEGLGEGFLEGLPEGQRKGLSEPFLKAFDHRFGNGSRARTRGASTSTSTSTTDHLPPSPDVTRDPVSSSSRGGQTRDDDGTRHTLDEAFELLARRLLEQRNAELVDRGRPDQVIPLDKPARVRAWISETANGERSHFEAVARAYLADNPEMAADELAEALAPELVLADAGSALA